MNINEQLVSNLMDIENNLKNFDCANSDMKLFVLDGIIVRLDVETLNDKISTFENDYLSETDSEQIKIINMQFRDSKIVRIDYPTNNEVFTNEK